MDEACGSSPGDGRLIRPEYTFRTRKMTVSVTAIFSHSGVRPVSQSPERRWEDQRKVVVLQYMTRSSAGLCGTDTLYLALIVS